MERLEIIEIVKDFPSTLEAEVQGLSDSVLRFRPAEKEWCIKEIVGNVTYAEEIWYRRFYAVWSMHDPILMTIDPRAEAATREAVLEAADLKPFLAKIEDTRLRTVHQLAEAVDWTRLGQWPGVGRRSFRQLAEALIASDAEQLARIRELKAAARAGAAT